MYELRLERRVIKTLKKLTEPVKSKLIKVLDGMKQDPFSGDIKALSGTWKGFYRRRVGNHRIIYCVDAEVRIINVESISDRKDAY